MKETEGDNDASYYDKLIVWLTICVLANAFVYSLCQLYR